MHKRHAMVLFGLIGSLFAALAPAQQPPATAPAAVKGNIAITPATREGGFMDYHKQYVAAIKKGGIDIIFTGDSITFNWRSIGKDVWDKNYASMNAANFGHGGDETQHLLWRLQNGECDGTAPKVVVLMIGTNNMGRKAADGRDRDTAAEIADGVTACVHELRKDWPTTKILLMAITPNGGTTPDKRGKLDATNQLLTKLDDKSHVFYFDIGPKFMDEKGFVPTTLIVGPHPTAAGYEIWAAAMKQPLDNLLHNKGLDGSPLPQ